MKDVFTVSNAIRLTILLAFIQWLVWGRAYDSTDDVENGVRSGLTLYTDHATGCQYLKASWFAALTPRMVRNPDTGNYLHVCRLPKDK